MVTINTEELFQTLAHAPIVEAVIDIRSRSAETLTEDLVRECVDPKRQNGAVKDRTVPRTVPELCLFAYLDRRCRDTPQRLWYVSPATISK